MFTTIYYRHALRHIFFSNYLFTDLKQNYSFIQNDRLPQSITYLSRWLLHKIWYILLTKIYSKQLTFYAKILHHNFIVTIYGNFKSIFYSLRVNVILEHCFFVKNYWVRGYNFYITVSCNERATPNSLFWIPKRSESFLYMS